MDEHARKKNQKADRVSQIVFLLLALGCFVGAFFCARTIELSGGYHAVANFLFQIPAMLGTLGLVVFGFMFLFLTAD